MFRSKRSSLVKRLWKSRVSTSNNQDETTSTIETPEELEIKSVAQFMLKRLKELQLELLVQAVESKGGDSTDCILVPKGELRLGRRTVAPHILCGQIWRWPDIKYSTELKRLSCCGSADDPAYICCNPYHWSRLCRPDSPPPPYSRFALERLKPEDRAPSEIVSTETGGTTVYGSQGGGHFDGSTSNGSRERIHWCNIAYWELRMRVGRLFTVFDKSINVFQNLPHGDGMCLGTLHSETNNDTIKRTREKIGFGLTLSKEDDGVWVYNRSEHAIFVNSPTLDIPNSRTLIVHKVLPGYSIKIFDFEKSHLYQTFQNQEFLDGPFDPNAVRISFAKGWGPCYTRQFITSCPCWLEILLNIPR